jgi:phospholipase/carboxylesterase
MMDERVIRIANLDARVVGSFDSPEIVVVVLHGFAMQPEDLSPFAHSLGVPGLFIFPQAPLLAEVEPGVHRGRAWWHIDPELRAASLARGPRDFAGEYPTELASARARLVELLDALPALVRGRDYPLVLAGFSQGGMLACDTCLREPISVSGLMLLSSSRIAFTEWALPLQRVRERASFPPVLVSHGLSDADLAFSTGEALRDALADAGANVTWVPFAGAHEIPLLVWRRVRKFLTSGLRPPEPPSPR